jgi:aminopeptidase N
MLALESVPEDAKDFLADVEKLAQNDPKTLVQGAAIGVLAKTKNPKYAPLFEKSLSSVSNSVKGNAIAGIAEINPEKVATLLDKMDLENANEEVMNKLLPIIVKNRITSQMPNIAQTVAFYPFIGFQNPALAQPAEEGFNWIMDTDNTKAVEKLTNILKQVKSQIGDNAQAKMMISDILKKGIERKMKLFRENPNNQSVNKQVELLNQTIEAYK